MIRNEALLFLSHVFGKGYHTARGNTSSLTIQKDAVVILNRTLAVWADLRCTKGVAGHC
jgi:hypothetical protein